MLELSIGATAPNSKMTVWDIQNFNDLVVCYLVLVQTSIRVIMDRFPASFSSDLTRTNLVLRTSESPLKIIVWAVLPVPDLRVGELYYRPIVYYHAIKLVSNQTRPHPLSNPDPIFEPVCLLYCFKLYSFIVA